MGHKHWTSKCLVSAMLRTFWSSSSYWSKLNGDGELVWGRMFSCFLFCSSPDILFAADPELTPLGISQAEEVRDVLEQELAAKLHLPSKLYSSPFTRALNTCQIQWEDILISDTNTVSVLEVTKSASISPLIYWLRCDFLELSRNHWCTHLRQTKDAKLYTISVRGFRTRAQYDRGRRTMDTWLPGNPRRDCYSYNTGSSSGFRPRTGKL